MKLPGLNHAAGDHKIVHQLTRVSGYVEGERRVTAHIFGGEWMRTCRDVLGLRRQIGNAIVIVREIMRHAGPHPGYALAGSLIAEIKPIVPLDRISCGSKIALVHSEGSAGHRLPKSSKGGRRGRS